MAPISVETNLDYLIPFLRLQLGDTDETSYRYLDEWLRTSLVVAIKNSARWMNDRYLIDGEYNVYRNPLMTYYFEFEEPPIIEHRDERVIILMASIVTKQGALENSAYDYGSWKDAEISYSNIESAKQRDSSLARDWRELEMLLMPPTKRLGKTRKNSLPGFKYNPFERSGDL